MSIEPLLHTPIETLAPDDSCAEAARLMRDENIGTVVVAEENRPVGMVTDRDIAIRVVAAGDDPERVAVQEIMSRSPIFVSRERSLDELIAHMRDLGIRRIPVVDEAGELVGIVALDDLLVRLSDQLSGLAHTIRKELAPPG